MSPARRLFSLLFGLSVSLFADQVRLTNGDVLSGTIQKMDGDHLLVNNPVVGDVSIPWSGIASLTSDNRLGLTLLNGKSVIGTLSTVGTNVEVATGVATETIPLADISGIRNHPDDPPPHPSVFALWTGYADVGLALTSGNSRNTTLATAFNATRITRNDRTTAYFNQIYGNSRTDGIVATNADAVRGGWAYSHNISPRWTYNLFNDYTYDRFQDLDLRFVIGGGLGYIAYQKEKTRLDILFGVDYNRESYGTGLVRNSAEGFLGDDWTYQALSSTSLIQSFRVFPNITSTGEYRLAFDLGAVTTLKKWLAFHVTFSDRFQSNPLPTYQRNDLFLTTGLRLTFGHP
jgi:putative salt-induced outer membrane protein YdiY